MPRCSRPLCSFPLSGALAAALALLGVWGLSRAAGFGSKAALAAGLILLCMPIFAPLAHFTGPAALAAALLLFSLICFCRGWQAQRAWFYLPAGFVLAGLAGLTGGLFHLLLPLLASALFLLWRATFRRAQALDALTGFVLLLLLLALWLGGIILWTNAEGYMQGLFATVAQWHGPVTARWWLPLAVAGLGLVPWIGMAVCVSWQRVLRSAWSDLKASRAERAGSAFVWISVMLACLLSLFMPMAQIQSVAVCLACLTAPLLGRPCCACPIWAAACSTSSRLSACCTRAWLWWRRGFGFSWTGWRAFSLAPQPGTARNDSGAQGPARARRSLPAGRRGHDPFYPAGPSGRRAAVLHSGGRDSPNRRP